MPPGWRKFQAVNAFTASVWTRDLRHVNPKAVFPRTYAPRFTFRDPMLKTVPVKDRIRWWNIVPGDQVRVLGAKGAQQYALREVWRVNKLNNRVLLKKESNADQGSSALKNSTDSVHYSRCQLLVGTQTYPPKPGEEKETTLTVFATRVKMTTPQWAPSLRRFVWQRFAENTVPRTLEYSKTDKSENTKVEIPWPKPVRREPIKPSPYDTQIDAVLEVTYQKPLIPSDPVALPSVASEQEYIRSLKKRSAFDLAAPVEVYVAKELSNPHSRALKQARWQAYQLYKKSLLQQMVKDEYKVLAGRTRAEARAEATWKWKARLIEERRAELKRREEVSGREAKKVAKRARKAKKVARINNKLRSLVLDDARNQVLPGRRAKA